MTRWEHEMIFPDVTLSEWLARYPGLHQLRTECLVCAGEIETHRPFITKDYAGLAATSCPHCGVEHRCYSSNRLERWWLGLFLDNQKTLGVSDMARHNSGWEVTFNDNSGSVGWRANPESVSDVARHQRIFGKWRARWIFFKWFWRGMRWMEEQAEKENEGIKIRRWVIKAEIPE